MKEVDYNCLIAKVNAQHEFHEDFLESNKNQAYYEFFRKVARECEWFDEEVHDREYARPWRKLMFEYIDNFYKGPEYTYFSALQFTGITKVLQELPSNSPNIIARTVNVDANADPLLFASGLLSSVTANKGLQMKMMNIAHVPIIIYAIDYNFPLGCYLGHMPFLLMPKSCMQDSFFPTTVVTIKWSVLHSPLSTQHHSISVPGVTHDDVTLLFEEISACSTSLNFNDSTLNISSDDFENHSVNILQGIDFVEGSVVEFHSFQELLRVIVKFIEENPNPSIDRCQYEEKVLSLLESFSPEQKESFEQELVEIGKRFPLYSDICEELAVLIGTPRNSMKKILAMMGDFTMFFKKLKLKPGDSQDISTTINTIRSSGLTTEQVPLSILSEFVAILNRSLLSDDSDCYECVAQTLANIADKRKWQTYTVGVESNFKEFATVGTNLMDNFVDKSPIMLRFGNVQCFPPVFQPKQLFSDKMIQDMLKSFNDQSVGVRNDVIGDKFESSLYHGFLGFYSFHSEAINVQRSAVFHSIHIGGKESLPWSFFVKFLDADKENIGKQIDEDEIDFVVLLQLEQVSAMIVIEAKSSYYGYRRAVLTKEKFDKYESIVKSNQSRLDNHSFLIAFLTIIGGAGKSPGNDELKIIERIKAKSWEDKCLIVPASGHKDKRCFDFNKFFESEGPWMTWLRAWIKEPKVTYVHNQTDMRINQSYEYALSFLVALKSLQGSLNQYEARKDYLSHRDCASEIIRRLKELEYMKTVDPDQTREKKQSQSSKKYNSSNNNDNDKRINQPTTVLKVSPQTKAIEDDSIYSIKITKLPSEYVEYVKFFGLKYITHEQKDILDREITSGSYVALYGNYGSGKTLMLIIKLAQTIVKYQNSRQKPIILVGAPKILMQRIYFPFLKNFFPQLFDQTSEDSNWVLFVFSYSELINKCRSNQYHDMYIFADEWIDTISSRTISGMLDYAVVSGGSENEFKSMAKSMFITIASFNNYSIENNFMNFDVMKLSYLLRYMPHLELIFSNQNSEKPVFGHKSKIFIVDKSNNYTNNVEVGMKHEIEFWKNVMEDSNEIVIAYYQNFKNSTLHFKSSGCHIMQPFLTTDRFDESGLEFKAGIILSNFSTNQSGKGSISAVNSSANISIILSRISYGFSWFVICDDDEKMKTEFPFLYQPNSGFELIDFDNKIAQRMEEALKASDLDGTVDIDLD